MSVLFVATARSNGLIPFLKNKKLHHNTKLLKIIFTFVTTPTGTFLVVNKNSITEI